MSIAGTWTLTMQTPMGLQTLTFIAKVEGKTLTGTMARGAEEPVAITDGAVEALAATWKLTVKTPMPMTLAFSGTDGGNSLSGTVKPGFFPAIPFSGTRIA